MENQEFRLQIRIPILGPVFRIRNGLNTDLDPDPAFAVNTDPDPAKKSQ